MIWDAVEYMANAIGKTNDATILNAKVLENTFLSYTSTLDNMRKYFENMIVTEVGKKDATSIGVYLWLLHYVQMYAFETYCVSYESFCSFYQRQNDTDSDFEVSGQ